MGKKKELFMRLSRSEQVRWLELSEREVKKLFKGLTPENITRRLCTLHGWQERVIELRLGILPDGRTWTWGEIADLFGTSVRYVMVGEARALWKLLNPVRTGLLLGEES